MYRFKWDEKMVGISLGVIGLLVGIVQRGLIRVINPKLGNEKSVYVGMALYTIGMFLFCYRYRKLDVVCFSYTLLFRRNSWTSNASRNIKSSTR